MPRDRKAIDESTRNSYFNNVFLLTRLDIPWPECGFDARPGWLPIIEVTLERLITAGWDKKLDQVKQKFCQLRIYISQCERDQNGFENELGLIIRQGVEACDKVCEVCGNERERKGCGMGWALCNACGKDE